jgi:hypothetical protein
MLVIVAMVSTGSAASATSEFTYQAGLSEIYSQDILRDGSDRPGYITDAAFTANLMFRSPRSSTTFSYVPEYLMYSDYGLGTEPGQVPLDLGSADHLDQRLSGLWELHAGSRSDVSLREGYSNLTRRFGFQDLSGSGGGASEPITGLTRLLAWDLEPHWELRSSPAATVFLDGLYRAARYSSEDLVDSDQFGLQWGMNGRVGRAQALGGQIRADAFNYWQDSGPVSPVYNRFVNAQATWTRAIPLRSSIRVAAGVYRGTGEEVDLVAGPTLDLSADWRWRRTSLFVSGGIGYSSGGGLSTTDRSRHVEGGWGAAWGEGYQASVNLSYIRREAIGNLEVASPPLYGRFATASFARVWRSGLGLKAGLSALRQDQTGGTALNYGEVSLGLVYAPPRPSPRPTEPG